MILASEICWRFLFRVGDQAAFSKCLARTLQVIGDASEVSDGKPYWKSPDLWECNVTVPAQGDCVAEQVLSCLIAAQRLATGWFVRGTVSSDCASGFNGVFASDQSGATSHVA